MLKANLFAVVSISSSSSESNRSCFDLRYYLYIPSYSLWPQVLLPVLAHQPAPPRSPLVSWRAQLAGSCWGPRRLLIAMTSRRRVRRLQDHLMTNFRSGRIPTTVGSRCSATLLQTMSRPAVILAPATTDVLWEKYLWTRGWARMKLCETNQATSCIWRRRMCGRNDSGLTSSSWKVLMVINMSQPTRSGCPEPPLQTADYL